MYFHVIFRNKCKFNIIPCEIADPFELTNRVHQLKPEERSFFHNQLDELVACKGKSCTVGTAPTQPISRNRPNLLPVLPSPQKYKKRKMVDEFGNGKIYKTYI